jgi:hypothetical protein
MAMNAVAECNTDMSFISLKLKFYLIVQFAKIERPDCKVDIPYAKEEDVRSLKTHKCSKRSTFDVVCLQCCASRVVGVFPQPVRFIQRSTRHPRIVLLIRTCDAV